MGDQKSAVSKADIDQINSALNDLKSGVNSAKQQQSQGLVDQMKRIEDANAASEKKWQDQQGLIGKLATQAEDATKMLGNMDNTMKDIASRAWQDGKKEILNIWESSKQDILNSVSSVTTGWIKDEKKAISDEIKSDLLAQIGLEADKKKEPLTDAELDAKIRTIVKEIVAEK